MVDAVRTDQAAVDDRRLIEQLNISMPFSPTDGTVRYDQRLPAVNYKGLYITGVPRTNEPGRYWFPMRGSLIRVANQGEHNNDFKDPFAMLYALDDLVTSLRIDPFRTPLNGLELSVTIPVVDPEQVCASIVSYLNNPPSIKTMNRDGAKHPYVEVEAGHHRLKVYAPTDGALRVEVNVHKMQHLGANGPQTFADLIHPEYAPLLVAKLMSAFKKVVWKYPYMELDALTLSERELYLQGRVYEYWRVRRAGYATRAEFKRAEKQRGREKKKYHEIILREWRSESPAELERIMYEQLNHYADLMRTETYQTVYNICLARWAYVGNLPGASRLPNHLKLPPLSEIYTSYLGKFPTQLSRTQPKSGKRWLSANDLARLPEKTGELLSGYKARRSHSNRPPQTDEERAWKRQRNWASNGPNNELNRLKKNIANASGLLCSLDELSPLLSARTRLALVYAGQSLSDMQSLQRRPTQPVPLFPDA